MHRVVELCRDLGCDAPQVAVGRGRDAAGRLGLTGASKCDQSFHEGVTEQGHGRTLLRCIELLHNHIV